MGPQNSGLCRQVVVNSSLTVIFFKSHQSSNNDHGFNHVNEERVCYNIWVLNLLYSLLFAAFNECYIWWILPQSLSEVWELQ